MMRAGDFFAVQKTILLPEPLCSGSFFAFWDSFATLPWPSVFEIFFTTKSRKTEDRKCRITMTHIGLII